MSLKTFLEKILPFLFKAAKREYDSLSEAQKEALKNGSGIVDVLNTEAGKTPAEIRKILVEKFPNIDVESTLFKVAHIFNLAPDENNLDDVIAKLQAYLSSHSEEVWAGIAQSIANIIAIILTPETTVFAKIGMLMEYVYRKYIKK